MKLYLHIALRIEEHIRSHQTKHLPSIRILADQYQVAEKTVWKALHILEERDVITCMRGRNAMVLQTPRVQDNMGSPQVSLSSIARQIYQILKDEIQSGARHGGERLPKCAFLSKKYHCSQQNVCRVFEVLQNEKHIHKQGKYWIVGTGNSRQSGPSTVLSSAKPVIVIVCLNYTVWKFFWGDQPQVLSPFSSELIGEIEYFDYSIQFAFFDEQADNLDFTRGKNQIRALISSLGNRYSGTLMITRRNEIPDPQPWVNFFLSFKNPVVFFDYGGDMGPDSDQVLHNPLYAFCRFNVMPAVRIAVTTLSDLGHKKIAVTRIVEGKLATLYSSWISERAQLIRIAAGACQPPLEVVDVLQSEPFWTQEQWEHQMSLFYQCLDSLIEKATAKIRYEQGNMRTHSSILDSVRHVVPSLCQIIDDPSITAIIAPNDHFARLYQICLQKLAVDIPHRLSIIGFDNEIVSRLFPLATVDFGFKRLGYLAAHFIMRDIPVKLHKGREIISEPRLIDRGSIALQ